MDYDFWLRMHLVTQFRHVAEPLYKYRVHRNSLTARAEELGLFANIREVQKAARWRIEYARMLLQGDISRDPQMAVTVRKELDEAGVTHPDMEKIKALLTSETESR